MSGVLVDYGVHFGLEAVGSLIAIFAYRSHHCQHWSHRALIWILLTAATTVITVNVVG